MSAGTGFNNQQFKQQSQYLNMRGAQIAQNQAGQSQKLEGMTKAKGSRKQLVGTIVGIACVVAVLGILSALRII